ncbi:MAG TPA: DNA internalization-related competence protein ComEC/Rec2 [Syntrophomonadaceae bacterium]|nr:DNA internalization-related competence protein ComEC/Rec2 [Syntrophomonadaceae bacterium]
MEKSIFYVFIALAVSLLLGFYKLWLIYFTLLGILLLVFAFTSYSRLAVYAAIILIVGVILANLSWKEIPEALPAAESFKIEGIVSNYPENDADTGKFVLKTDHPNQYLRKVQVFLRFSCELERGDRIQITGSLKPPAPPGNPGQFNYPAYLQHENIFYTLSVENQADIVMIQPASGLYQGINSFRRQGVEVINAALTPQEAAVMLGMLLGKVDGIGDEQYNDYQKTGIIHIFSVSGLHVGFLVILCGWITTLLKMSKRNKFLFSITLIVLYGTLTGWPVSVVRASLMAVTGLAAYYFGRENQMLNSLGLAGIIILLLDPQALFKISFQLSFLATFGLVYIFPILRQRVNHHQFFWDLILIPLSAQLAVIPLIAWHFNILSPVSIVSNIIITYAAGLSVILGFFALAAAPFLPGLATLIIYPAGVFNEIIIQSNAIFKNLPLAYIWVATPSIIAIVIYYAGLALTLWATEGFIKVRYLLAGLFMILICITGLCLPAGIYNRGVAEAVFIDVGQGDSILIKTPQGKFILVDGGGSQFYDVASTRLLPYLHHRGIREIYMAVNSHPDTDHLTGLEKVAEELKISYLGIPQSVADVPEYNKIKALTASKQGKIIPLKQGQVVKIEEDFTIKVLYPEAHSVSTSDYNQQSLVLEIGMPDWSVLLAGDLNQDQLEEITGQGVVSPADIVKVPHHGSRYSLSEKFYCQSNPEWAVICVGNNNFGHPHAEVLELLEEQKIKTLRTDKQGNIYFDSTGRVETFKQAPKVNQ